MSCYAFFEGWLLLSLPPRCLRLTTPFGLTFGQHLGTLTSVWVVPLSVVELTWIRSLRGKWTLSDPCFPVSALPHQPPRSGLGSGPLRKELAITRLDWSLAPSPRSGERIARQNPFEPPLGFRLASPCPGIDRLVSSFMAVTSGPFRPCAWQPSGCCALIGFPLLTGF